SSKCQVVIGSSSFQPIAGGWPPACLRDATTSVETVSPPASILAPFRVLLSASGQRQRLRQRKCQRGLVGNLDLLVASKATPTDPAGCPHQRPNPRAFAPASQSSYQRSASRAATRGRRSPFTLPFHGAVERSRR